MLPKCRTFETRSLLPRSFTLITRTARARASYLAALQSTRAIPNRGVFYVADPISSIPVQVVLAPAEPGGIS